VWAYWERDIETFHPFWRHPKYCEYAQSLLSSARGVEGLGSWGEWAGHVYDLQSSDELRDFLAGRLTAKFVKVYISPAREHKRETVEFREHRGTTDAVEIRWWVVFIERVIQYCWRLAESGFRFFVPGSELWNINNTEDMWRVIEMPEEGRNFLRGKIHEYGELNPDDFYPSSSSGETNPPGSQTSMDRNSDDGMDLDETDDGDVDSNYSTKYKFADTVQPHVGEGYDMSEGEVVDAVTEWGTMAKYGRPDPE